MSNRPNINLACVWRMPVKPSTRTCLFCLSLIFLLLLNILYNKYIYYIFIIYLLFIICILKILNKSKYYIFKNKIIIKITYVIITLI